MAMPTHLLLAIINRGRVMIVDEPIPNHPQAIADLAPACAQIHANTRRAVHFQLRDPAHGRPVWVLEHGATSFQPMQGYRHG